MTAQILIGTSGWSYPSGEGTWNGHFYPPGTKNELEYYSQFFNTVEINSTFYRPPNPAFAVGWAKKTPPGFLFSVKLWQKFTHPKMYKEATGVDAAIEMADVDLFRKGIEPLARAGKLGAMLAQFPPSFKNGDFGQQFIAALVRHFGEYHLAVELRHRSWSDDPSTEKLLRQNNTAWVQCDEPKFASSLPPNLPLTADFAYLRFHGRNVAEWWTGTTETRYRYLYPPEEIRELAGKAQAAAAKTKLLFGFFNNHWQAYSPRNAVHLLKEMHLPFREITVSRE